MKDQQMIDLLRGTSSKTLKPQTMLSIAFRLGELVDENEKLKNTESIRNAKLLEENNRLKVALESVKEYALQIERNENPCINCNRGWGRTTETGYVTCQDVCKKYKDFRKMFSTER